MKGDTMFCPNCGESLPDEAAFCGGCGTKIQQAAAAVAQTQPAQVQTQAQNPYQGQQGYQPQNPYQGQQGYQPQGATQYQGQNPSYYSAQSTQANAGVKSKTTAGLLAILLGVFGAQFFYLGHTVAGIVCILLIFTMIGPVVTGIFGIVQGIMMLTKSDEEFQRIWVQEQKLFF